MTTKTYYQTDRLGFYVGPVEVDPSPLEKDVWLIPAGCVAKAPPAIPAGKAAFWTGAQWTLTDNLENMTAYNTKTREPRVLSRFDALPAGYTLLVPGAHQIWREGQWVDDIPTVLVTRHAAKTLQVNQACETQILSGFTSKALGAPHAYQSGLYDQINLVSAIGPADVVYPCRDDEGIKAYRAHTPQQLRQVLDDFTTLKLQQLQKAHALKQRLDQALSADDIDAIEAVTWSELQS
ncbi:phage tail protein [Pseudomonas atacamensis]|uniref:phage tail protein n=1 Tax=Pseudomonas atacamensis TaxID=2565368 RepID=UPI00244D1BEB|nr:phage tail protein [Pseudomonas atacamensis]MDH2080315.1 phage tail protein [Pseudomonas atacamensis]